MLDGGQPDKPAITVLSAAAGPVERAVLAGIEEEGVPCVLTRCPDGTDRDAAALAREAARLSTLDVGVGIDQHSHVHIGHELLTEAMPELASPGPATAAFARLAGHNAARIVVGIPLRISPA